MGSTGSIPRQHKVAPCNSLQEDGEQPRPQWTLPALPVTGGQSSGSLDKNKRMKQDIIPLTSSGQSLSYIGLFYWII